MFVKKEKILDLYHQFKEKDYATVALPFIGMGLQFLIWLILLPVGFAFQGSETLSSFYGLLTYTSFSVHALSIFGVYLAVQQLRSGRSAGLPLLGLFLNLIWFLIFLWVCILALTGAFSI